MPGVESQGVDEMPPEPSKPVDSAVPPPPPPPEAHSIRDSAESVKGAAESGGGFLGSIGKVIGPVADRIPGIGGAAGDAIRDVGGALRGVGGNVGKLMDDLKAHLEVPPTAAEKAEAPAASAPPAADDWAGRFAHAEAEAARADAAEAQAMQHLASPRPEDQLRGQAEMQQLHERMRAQVEALRSQGDRAGEAARDVK
jgi:hypothetical protein